MRFALIGCTGHWTTYVPALKALPDLTLAAVAPATPEDSPATFERAAGVTGSTRRYRNPEQLLETEKLDFVQVCCRTDQGPVWTAAALKRGLPVVAEKPLAMNLETLAALWKASEQTPLIPMHAQRGSGWLAAAQRAVAAGTIGKPLSSYHQKSYKWGATRPDWYRSRCTFAGLAPYAGIHAFDWVVWVLGSDWSEVSGWESSAARPEFPACAANGGYLLRGKDGQTAHVSVDYLRPAGAPTHGDERLRVAGTEGALEMAPALDVRLLLRGGAEPEILATPEPEDWYVSFVRRLRGEGESVIRRKEAFRATEIALKAQLAADTGRPQSLAESTYI